MQTVICEKSTRTITISGKSSPEGLFFMSNSFNNAEYPCSGIPPMN